MFLNFLQQRNRVDVVFLIDATGAMEICIDAIKLSLGLFFDTLTGDQSPIKDWRARVIGYRDANCDGDMWLETNPFVANDLSGLKSQFDRLTPQGGGDEPESLLDALSYVCNWGELAPAASPNSESWRHRADCKRAIVLFTNATYHPTMSAKSVNAGGTADDVISELATKKITLLMVAPDSACFDKLTEADKSVLVKELVSPFAESLTSLSNADESFQKVMQALAKTLTVETPVEIIE